MRNKRLGVPALAALAITAAAPATAGAAPIEVGGPLVDDVNQIVADAQTLTGHTVDAALNAATSVDNLRRDVVARTGAQASGVRHDVAKRVVKVGAAADGVRRSTVSSARTVVADARTSALRTAHTTTSRTRRQASDSVTSTLAASFALAAFVDRMLDGTSVKLAHPTTGTWAVQTRRSTDCVAVGGAMGSRSRVNLRSIALNLGFEVLGKNVAAKQNDRDVSVATGC